MPMIRRRHALLTLAFALMILSAPVSASALHLQPEEDYESITCHSGVRPPFAVRSDHGLFSGFGGCSGGDPGHITYEVKRNDSAVAKGIVTELKDELGESSLAYSALRPGRDQVSVTASDGKSSGTATITLENVFREKGTALPRQATVLVPSKKGIISVGLPGCPEFSFPAVGSCKVAATARATIRERGKPRRTVTIARASLTLRPGQGKDLNVKLSTKFLRVLKQARQIKMTVVQTSQQPDPFGLWRDKRTDKVTLYSRR